MNKNKSEHILNSASSLLGFSFIAITTLRALNLIHKTHVDEFASITLVMFMMSVIFSFLSIRSSDKLKSDKFEKIADGAFLFGLFIMLLLIVLIETEIV